MGYLDRTSAEEGHILIGGTGRTGTTLLVQWFTALGFDTGFDLESARKQTDPISGGGLEHSLGRTLKAGLPMPYVAKSPWFGANLDEYLASGQLRARAAVIPIRQLGAAAESRRQVSDRAEQAGLDPAKHPGGILGAGQAGVVVAKGKQEQRLARTFFDLVYTLVAHDVPIYFLRFPDFALGRQDLYTALRPLLEPHGVTHDESNQALLMVVRPDLIHNYETTSSHEPA
jgi:hypothetical protein